MNQFRTYCLTSSSEVNRLPSQSLLGDQKWPNNRERGLDCLEGDRVGRLTHAYATFLSRDLHP